MDRRRKNAGVVKDRKKTEKDQIMNESDQSSKQDCAETRDDSHKDREERQAREPDPEWTLKLQCSKPEIDGCGRPFEHNKCRRGKCKRPQATLTLLISPLEVQVEPASGPSWS